MSVHITTYLYRCLIGLLVALVADPHHHLPLQVPDRVAGRPPPLQVGSVVSWFQSEIDCVRQWGLEEQWGHEQGLLCALPSLQVGSVVSV